MKYDGYDIHYIADLFSWSASMGGFKLDDYVMENVEVSLSEFISEVETSRQDPKVKEFLEKHSK